MRCPNCNKFVGYTDPEVEIQSTDLDENHATVTARVVLKCAECGDELKDAEITSEVSITHDCPDENEKGETPEAEFEWDDEPTEGEASDRTETKDRNGKQIKNSRYMKRFYGFSACGSVKCVHCGDVINLDFDGEEQASGFNELG
jgi:hypothetical protein